MDVPVWRPWIFLYVLLSISILIGNVLALVVFFVAKPLAFNIRCLLINLAFADSLVGAVALPMYSALIAEAFTGRLSPTSELPIVYTAIDIFAAFGSILSLVAIAFDRVKYTVSHQNTSGAVYLVAIIFIWLGAAVMAILYILSAHKIIPIGGFFLPMIITFFLTVLVIIAVYAYLWIMVILMKIDQASGSRTIEKKLGITFLMITVLFIVMWIPFQVLNIMVFQEGGKCHIYDCKFEMVAFTKLFHYGNSLVNPFIYSLRIPGFRKAAVQLLCYRRLSPEALNNATINTYDHEGTRDVRLHTYENVGYNAKEEKKATYDNPGFVTERSREQSPPAHNPNFNPVISPDRTDSNQPSMFI